MKIHLIAIGGSIMHNLAIALHLKGHEVTGSDDQIYEPAKSRLDKYGLLPQPGWDSNKISKELDCIILGMHAAADNPELLKAKKLGIAIYSFPEFVAKESVDKKRVVVAGSHGKTSTTSMIMHALKHHQYDFDYLVGAIIDGFDVMVRLSDAPIIVIEGDEYLSSKLDMRPKFLHYLPDISIITGVAWDHVNTFPTKEGYNEQFKNFVETHAEDASIFYFGEDPVLNALCFEVEQNMMPYREYEYKLTEEKTSVSIENKEFSLPIFGAHNMQNLKAASLACQELGMSEVDFLQAMQTFTGASKRLEKLVDLPLFKLYKDFAHAPSKARATIKAIREKYKDWKVTAILELHTFSSLNKDFLPEYEGVMDGVEQAVVCFSPATIRHKGMEMLDEKDVFNGFSNEDIEVVTQLEALESLISGIDLKKRVILFMSSGNFLGFDLDTYSKKC